MTIFHSQDDYDRFMASIAVYKKRYPCLILSYCLMPNHFHFLLQEPEMQEDLKGQLQRPLRSSISMFMQQLQNAYARYYAVKYNFSGRVFQGVYKSKLVKDDAYLQYLSCYIHYNPTAAGLVDDSLQWRHSSFRNYWFHDQNDVTDVDKLPYDGDYKELFQSYLAYREEREQTLEALMLDEK